MNNNYCDKRDKIIIIIIIIIIVSLKHIVLPRPMDCSMQELLLLQID